MPNVRASSGTMGTTRGPNASSRMRFRSRPVMAMVVDTARPSDPLARPVNTDGSGSVRGRLLRIRRLGMDPPRARRRCTMYSCSGLSSSGL